MSRLMIADVVFADDELRTLIVATGGRHDGMRLAVFWPLRNAHAVEALRGLLDAAGLPFPSEIVVDEDTYRVLEPDMVRPLADSALDALVKARDAGAIRVLDQ